MPFLFDDAIAVRRERDNLYSGRVHDGWDIRGNANGGYLLALMGSAMRAASDGLTPVTASMHYLAPINDADVIFETSVMKRGKSFTTVNVIMRAGERVVAHAIGTCAASIPETPTSYVSVQPPELPSFADAVDRRSTDESFPLALMSKVEVRLHPDDTGFARNEPSGQALMRGWCQFRDLRPPDALGLMLMCDAFPPTVFNLPGENNWVPTLQLSFYLRGIPADGPLQCLFTSAAVQSGYFDEDGAIWDSTGRLVAQSRQLALMPLAR